MKHVLKPLAMAAGIFLTTSAAWAQGPKLEVVAEWNRLSYDLGDKAAEKAYEDQQVYKRC